MLHGYRAVFRAPGSAAFCLAGFVMRAPIAIYPLALVLVISSRSGHFGFAGVLTGDRAAQTQCSFDDLVVRRSNVGRRRRRDVEPARERRCYHVDDAGTTHHPTGP